MSADLARELVRHPRWRWAPGMLALENATPGAALYRDGRIRLLGDGLDAVPHAATPDLRDAATQGCIVRAYLDAVDQLSRGPWTVAQRDEFHRRLGAAMCDPDGIMQAEALLDAWEALGAQGGTP